MSETKKCVLSAILSIAFSMSLFGAYSFADNTAKIQKLHQKASSPVYLSSEAVMNKEMAAVMLPLLKKQQKEEAERSRIKKPDIVYAPEQLQNSRGY